MQYKKDKYANKISMLGLGCMRFSTNKAETERMILRAIEGGVNFFDTAYIYPGSEKTLGEILAKHNKRKDVFISTKLPFGKCRKYEDFDRYFNEQLDRLKTDYIDYYFLHNISGFAQWKTYKELGIERWIAEKKESGKIRQIGFSYHGNTKDFIKIIDDYDWEFTMIQYNYSDEFYQAGVVGLKHAGAKGIPVFIMEPLLGGRLATGLPKAAVNIFRKAENGRSPAEWAFRWLWNQPEVTMVLSGMNSEHIMNLNLDAVKRFSPLTGEELKVYDDVIAEFKKAYKINCTGCDYCLPCPKGINIPSCFSAYNNSFSQSYYVGLRLYILTTAAVSNESLSPSKCTNCGICEKKCPQNIKIREQLKAVTKRFEPVPVRAGLKIIKKIMS